jgi:hypothetical protein
MFASRTSAIYDISGWNFVPGATGYDLHVSNTVFVADTKNCQIGAPTGPFQRMLIQAPGYPTRANPVISTNIEGQLYVGIGAGIGTNNGDTTNQGSVAFGNYANQFSPGENSVALGTYAGNAGHAQNAVSIGFYAGATGVGGSSMYNVAVGSYAGSFFQGNAVGTTDTFKGDTLVGVTGTAVAIGNNAGRYAQGQGAVAIGAYALQGTIDNKEPTTNYAVAIGYEAALLSIAPSTVAIGNRAGNSGMGYSSIAIGMLAQSIGDYNISIGSYANAYSERYVLPVEYNISIGCNSGPRSYQMHDQLVSIGYLASANNTRAVAIGNNSYAQSNGNFSVGYAIAIGSESIADNSSLTPTELPGNPSDAIAIGTFATSVPGGIAIGYKSITNSNHPTIAYCISIGSNASSNIFSTSIGDNTMTEQSGVALGFNSLVTATGGIAVGPTGRCHGFQGIAIGCSAYVSTGSTNGIAIGAGAQSYSGGIALGNNVTATGQSLFVNPIRAYTGAGTSPAFFGVLRYDDITNEVTFNNVKTFVIQNPVDKDKYLVHSCLEGPEAGIYYRGEGKITNNDSVTIALPHYVSAIGYDFTVQVTPIYHGKIRTYNASRVQNNEFTVHGENGEFTWLVHATRGKIVVEPNKSGVELRGDGPYTYLT